MSNKRNDYWHETAFERWFDVNPFLPGGERILLVDRHQPIRRMIDLIALDREGGLVILEIKNEPTDRRAIGQGLEYLAHYEDATIEDLLDDDEGAHDALREAFSATFGRDLPKLGRRRRVFLVAPSHDSYAAVCTRLLSRHLSGGDLSFQLLRASKSAAGFALEDYDSPRLERTSALGRTFGLSARGRLFYILEPGSSPVVWNIGRLRDGNSAIAFRLKASRRTLRVMRWHLMPAPPPEQVDLSNSGTVWNERDRPDRLAKVIGSVRAGGRGDAGESYVVFAAFRGDEFRTFRKRPATEFFSRWAASGQTLPDWRTVALLAQRQVDAQKTGKRSRVST